MITVDLTIIIPTKNEEKNLAMCLEPIHKWAKKIIVVDSNSIDRTVEIAKIYNTEIIFFNYKGGWPKKRQYVIENYKFTTGWILLLDADEILTNEAKQEIENSIYNSDFHGFYIYFKLYFLGKILLKSDPGLRKLSLFRTGKGNFERRFEQQDHTMGDMEIHEHLIVDGKIGQIKAPVIHKNVNNLSRFITKHDEYSNYESRVHVYGTDLELSASFWGTTEQRRRYLKKKLIRNPLFPILMFFYLYLFKGGFLEGYPGFYYILYQTVYLYFVSSKIYEIEKNEKK